MSPFDAVQPTCPPPDVATPAPHLTAHLQALSTSGYILGPSSNDQAYISGQIQVFGQVASHLLGCECFQCMVGPGSHG